MFDEQRIAAIFCKMIFSTFILSAQNDNLAVFVVRSVEIAKKKHQLQYTESSFILDILVRCLWKKLFAQI